MDLGAGPAWDLVRLVEIDGNVAPEPPADPDGRAAPLDRQRGSLSGVQAALVRWDWWRWAGPSTRRVAVGAAVAVVAAGAVVGAAAGAGHPVRQRTRTVASTSDAVDATGCPLRLHCAVRDVPKATAMLVYLDFTPVIATEVFDPSHPRSGFDRQLVALRAGATMTVRTRCSSGRDARADDPAPAYGTTVRRVVSGVQVLLRETNWASRRYDGTCTVDVTCVQTNPLYTAQQATSCMPAVRAVVTDDRVLL